MNEINIAKIKKIDLMRIELLKCEILIAYNLMKRRIRFS